MARNHDLSDRIWHGDVSAVEESKDRFLKDPERLLVSHASVLYSFCNHRTNAEELKDLRFRLLAQADEALKGEEPRTETDREKCANRLETMAAILQWISRQKDLPEVERRDLRKSVHDLCSLCIGLTASRTRHHTYSLVRLTIARQILDEGNPWLAEQYLMVLAEVAPGIEDARQRNRVYRGLGALNRALGRVRQSLYWGIRACVQRDVPLAVRAKSVAVFFGYAK